MAILYAEKFGKYGAGADIGTDNTAFTQSGSNRTIQAATGRFGDATLQITSTNTSVNFPWAAITASETVIIGMSVRDYNDTGANVGDNQLLIQALDPGSQVHWRLDMTPGGLVLYRSGGFGTLQAVSRCPIGHRRWHWIEIKAVMQNSGSVEVRVDGVTVINETGVDFRDGASDTITDIRIYGGRHDRQFDEIIICDDTGSTFNNFFGDVRIKQAVPDADGSTVDWTASAGTDVSCVDDAIGSYNDDTDYISSSTTDQESLFSHAALTLTSLLDVKFVQLSTLARDDGSNTFRQLARSGGTTYDNGADKNHGTAYSWANHRWELDPNGAIEWDETSINAAEFGVRARA